MTDYYPHVEGLTFVQELPKYHVVVTLEVTQRKPYTFAVNILKGVEGVVIRNSFRVHKEVELPLFDVNFILEEASHVGHVFEEGRSHERFLAVQTGDLSDFVDEVEDTGGDVDYFAAHDFEELSEQLTGFLDKVDSCNLFLASFIDLLHQKLLHVDVVIFTEELQEAEGAAEG